jgi:acyl-CoA thioesterase-2
MRAEVDEESSTVTSAQEDGRGPATTVREVIDLISLPNSRFLAPPLELAGSQPLFGGQLVAQALAAASLTVLPDRLAQSVHSYFLQPAKPGEPVIYRVRRDRDGGRYSWRQVTAAQGTEVIFSLSCIFSRSKPGADFQAIEMPAVAPPEALQTYPLETLRTRDASRLFDLEARFFADPLPWIGGPLQLWLRVREALSDEPNAHACGVVFLSDMSNGLSSVPDARPDSWLMSLDHTVWLHRPCRADDWLLMDLQPHTTGSGRGLYTGHIFDRAGALVASLAQECLFANPPEHRQ